MTLEEALAHLDDAVTYGILPTGSALDERTTSAIRLVADRARENVQAEVVAKTQAATARALEVANATKCEHVPGRVCEKCGRYCCKTCGTPLPPGVGPYCHLDAP